MINRIKNRQLREETKNLLYSLKDCKHAIYGLCYATPNGNIIEQLADCAQEARFFYDESSFNQCIDVIYSRYKGCGCNHLNIYCVHRAE